MSEAALRELGIVAIRAARIGGTWRAVVCTLRGFEIVTAGESFAAALDQAIREIRSLPEALPN